MNIKKYLGILLALIISLSCIVFTSAPVMAAALSIEAKFSDSFSVNGSVIAVHTGLVNTKAATISDKVDAPVSRIATLITPEASNNVVGLKHYNTPRLNIALSELDYIRYRYYYDGDGFEGQRAKIVIKQSDFNMSRDCTVYSLEPVVSGKWAYLTFAVKEEIWGYILPNGILPEIEFYPFGDNAASTVASEKLYLDELAFWNAECANAIIAKSNGELVHKYPVYFEPGRSDVSGTKPETIYAILGDTITLPECTFEKEGYIFNGWICSEGSVRMYPGDEYTLTTKSINGGITYNSPRTYFVADWKSLDTTAQELPSVNNVLFSSYSNGITDNRNYATYKKNVQFDGLDTVEFTFYPSNSNASTHNANLDGWSWSNLPLDFAKYKYLIILYYFETEGTSTAFRPYVDFLGSSSDSNALSKTLKFNAKKNLSYNKWDIMCFEFDIMNNYASYVKSPNDTILRQMHFYPIGANRPSKLTEGDKLYVANFIFLDEIPSTTPTYNAGYLTGYEDGTFKPNGILTNAEAVSLVTKSMGLTQSTLEKYTETDYSDIDSDDWFFGSVAYLESIGALKPAANEKFNPNGEASRAEFIRLMVNLKSGDTEALQAGSISSSLDSGVLTRAEAVTYINNLYYDSTYSPSVVELFTKSPFTDVTPGQWFYPDIVLGASDAITYKRADGSTVATGIKQKNATDDNMLITDEQYAEALTYVADLDNLTKARIDEIRNTESEYKVGPHGTVYYISSSDGSESSPGTSLDNPRYVSTLNEVNNLSFKPGDVVLFKRGDTFRGNMTGSAGVTYSAYGVGDKPVFTRSPENGSGRSKWSLAYEDKATGAKIWKYYDETYVDVGAINLISSNGEHFVAYKNIPDYQQILGDDVTDDADYIPGEENFWIRGGLGITPFKVVEELDHDFEFVHLAQYSPDKENPGKADYDTYSISSGCPASGAVGPLYLRCDAGNPGTLYPRIEFNLKTTIFSASSNDITIDNICFKYFGSHGIGSGKNNLTVRNCEIGWGGGAIQHYGTSSTGRVTRFGNGVEIYGGLVNYIIDNCYVYQIYDAGITHQISSSSDGNYYMEGVYYTNNVLTHSTYNIEYFMSINTVKGADGTVPKRERFMKDVYFTDNIVRYAGYGWGVQRPDNCPSNVKGWTHHKFVTNYVIEGNVFDRCVDLQNNNTDYLLQVGSTYESSTPYLVNNIFVQTPGRCIMYYGKKYVNCDLNGEEILNTIGGTGNKLYFYPDDYEDYTYMLFWRD